MTNRVFSTYGRILLGFTALGMAVLLTLVVWLIAQDAPSLEDVIERQTGLQEQIEFLTCLALVPDLERPGAVAECQVSSAP